MKDDFIKFMKIVVGIFIFLLLCGDFFLFGYWWCSELWFIWVLMNLMLLIAVYLPYMDWTFKTEIIRSLFGG